MTDHMEPIARIGRRLHKEGKAIGLEMVRFNITPSLSGEAHTANVAFILEEDAPAARINVDAEFDKMMDEQAKAAEEERARQARENMKSLNEELRDPKKGIGLDDD